MLGPIAWMRNTGAAVILSGMLVTTGVVLSTAATANYGTVTATTAVNLRSGPGTNYSIQGVLYRGNSLRQVGAAKNGFTPVSYRNRTVWVSSQYIRGASGGTTETMDAQTKYVSKSVTTASLLNVRSGPSLSAGIVGQLPKGTTVELTGRISGQWSQITYKGKPAWVSGAYLAAPGTTSTNDLSSKVKQQGRGTTALMIRTTPGTDFRSLGDAPTGTIFDLTGVEKNGMKQIVWKGVLRWVNGRYVVPLAAEKPAPTSPSLPKTIATRYTTAALNVRTAPSLSATIVTTTAKGAGLPVTGVVQSGFAQVIYQGAVRWASASYLSNSAPADTVTAPKNAVSTKTTTTTPNTWDTLEKGGSSGLTGLTANSRGVVDYVLKNFTQIRTIYGVRPDPLPDHPSGRAVDLMLPNYKSNNALGREIANDLRAHAKELNIQYIIFDQQIWNISRDSEGWRMMADRGSDTANHKDHVHVTVKP